VLGYARVVLTEGETVVYTTPNAPWLPRGGRADVIRRITPPRPMSVVRLLLRRADQVFCVPRATNGQLDLPMQVVEMSDFSGATAIRELASKVVGRTSELHFIGAVRNVVGIPGEGYPWPTPLAHFGVWASDEAPVVDGTWMSIESDEPGLRDRHWFPLAS
jgi:hypothetical protein